MQFNVGNMMKRESDESSSWPLLLLLIFNPMYFDIRPS